MFAVPVTREMRAISVLLGGSGRARMSTTQTPPLAALFRPCPSALPCADWESEVRAAGDGSC